MSQTSGGVPRILHLHSTFSAGGKEVRCARLMNAWGPRLHHTIISAEPQAMAAAALIDAGVPVDYPQGFPSLKGKPTPARLARLARAMQGFDLICTYNWGAMDAVMAHRVFARSLKLPPLVHHEDGFNEDEAERLKPTRNLYRRVALGGAAAVIVPSTGLEATAREVWGQPARRVHRIANGIDTTAFAAVPDPAALPMPKPEGQHWVGTLAGLRPVKQLPALVEACAALPSEWHLVICGEGPERAAILAAAARHGMADRLHLPGAVDPARVVGLFDIFALSSASEQSPLSVVEAMAAGLPVAAPDVGDIAAILAEPNRAFITRPQDTPALAAALEHLAGDAALRASLGAANQARARAEFDLATMLSRYTAVYASAMSREF
ncbi:glycosyltransferase [Porphyrobacter sp. SLTP]|uniref:glycosyltransferase n=1 Tax=Porphyrobacter sp. SLTP TaxID=2683266 RepID=UPI001411C3B3|nr:glycosyltransferase [Porphyrobacter sp. SLTP]